MLAVFFYSEVCEVLELESCECYLRKGKEECFFARMKTCQCPSLFALGFFFFFSLSLSSLSLSLSPAPKKQTSSITHLLDRIARAALDVVDQLRHSRRRFLVFLDCDARHTLRHRDEGWLRGILTHHAHQGFQEGIERESGHLRALNTASLEELDERAQRLALQQRAVQQLDGFGKRLRCHLTKEILVGGDRGSQRRAPHPAQSTIN